MNGVLEGRVAFANIRKVVFMIISMGAAELTLFLLAILLTRPVAFDLANPPVEIRTTRVVLATANLDHDPTNNRSRNLKALCQRCHMLHDRLEHHLRRDATLCRRRALGDLFEGTCTYLQ